MDFGTILSYFRWKEDVIPWIRDCVGITAMGQKFNGGEGLDGLVDDLRVMDVFGTFMSGSLKSTAVAGIVLGARNVPSIVFEKIESTTAPGIPATNAATSASTTAFVKAAVGITPPPANVKPGA